MDNPTPAPPVPGQLTLDGAERAELAELREELKQVQAAASEGASLLIGATTRLGYISGCLDRLSEPER